MILLENLKYHEGNDLINYNNGEEVPRVCYCIQLTIQNSSRSCTIEIFKLEVQMCPYWSALQRTQKHNANRENVDPVLRSRPQNAFCIAA